MSYYIAKKKDGRRLEAFFPNDLPNRTKNGVGFKNIISFRNNSFLLFGSEKEAIDYIKYMAHQVDERAEEYNKIHWCADGCLKDIIYRLKVYRLE